MKQLLQLSEICVAVNKLTSVEYEKAVFRLVVAWLLAKEFGITLPI